MKNKDLKRTKLTDSDKLDHKRERNRLKRYKQGRIDLYTLTDKKKKDESVQEV